MRRQRGWLLAVVPGLVAIAVSCGPDGTTDRTTLSVGPSGGTLSGPKGASVVVPSGAVSGSVTLTAETATTAAAPPDVNTVGDTLIFGPEGQKFSAPVEVTLTVDESKLPAGTSLADVVIFTAPIDSEKYEDLGGTVAGSGKVRATTTHFSKFVPVVRKNHADGGTDGGSGGGSGSSGGGVAGHDGGVGGNGGGQSGAGGGGQSGSSGGGGQSGSSGGGAVGFDGGSGGSSGADGGVGGSGGSSGADAGAGGSGGSSGADGGVGGSGGSSGADAGAGGSGGSSGADGGVGGSGGSSGVDAGAGGSGGSSGADAGAGGSGGSSGADAGAGGSGGSSGADAGAGGSGGSSGADAGAGGGGGSDAGFVSCPVQQFQSATTCTLLFASVCQGDTAQCGKDGGSCLCMRDGGTPVGGFSPGVDVCSNPFQHAALVQQGCGFP